MLPSRVESKDPPLALLQFHKKSRPSTEISVIIGSSNVEKQRTPKNSIYMFVQLKMQTLFHR